MTERTVIHSTFVLERHFAASPEKVFAALADPEKKRRWMAEGRGMPVEEYAMDFRTGGRERARYRMPEGTPFPGAILGNDTVYQDIVPNQRVVLAYTMSMEGRCFSASLATFELVPNGTGTDLIFTDQGAYFEHSDGPKMREDGWNQLLSNLAKELSK